MTTNTENKKTEQLNTEQIQDIEKTLREYFARLSEHRITVPEEFPCPIPGRISQPQDLNLYIDHTLLKQSATARDYEALFAEARSWKPYSVCVPPLRVSAAVEALAGSGVKVCTVVGFPWGYDSPLAKAVDASQAISLGCAEIDMVISVGELIEGNYAAVYKDISAVVEAAGGTGSASAHTVKVILETSELSGEDIVRGCLLSGWAGACFVKTSIGFASAGASLEAVSLMRRVVGDRMGVKASGGIRDRAFTEELIQAGADRIGASATGTILGLSPPPPNAATPKQNGSAY